MFKQVILVMQGKQYPFGQAQNLTASTTNQTTKTLVRKIYQTKSLHDRNLLLQKIYTIKSIPHQKLMKIESVLEQQNYIHILYEYIPCSFIKQINNLDQNSLMEVRKQILDLGTNLAEAGVLVDWDIKNIGIGINGNVKYYLELESAKLDKKIGAVRIQKIHLQLIMNMFSNLHQSNGKPKGSNELMESLKLNDKQQHGYSIHINKTDLQKQKTRQKHSRETSFAKQLTSNSKKNFFSEQQGANIPTRTDWRSMDNQNSEFMSDFLNVLDDKSENAQSQYVEDLQQQYQRIGQIENQSPNVENEEEQIVWMSASGRAEIQQPKQQQEQQKYQQNSYKNQSEFEKSDDEEIVWVDYRSTSDVKERAMASIKRSTQVLSVFKNILREN